MLTAERSVPLHIAHVSVSNLFRTKQHQEDPKSYLVEKDRSAKPGSLALFLGPGFNVRQVMLTICSKEPSCSRRHPPNRPR